MLSLEYLTALELARRIRAPGSIVMEQFSRGELAVQEITVTDGCKATEAPVRGLGLTSNIRFGAIRRANKTWIATAEDQLVAGDQVTVFCHPDEKRLVKSLFRQSKSKAQRVVIVGGGETGFQLARDTRTRRFSRDDHRSGRESSQRPRETTFYNGRDPL